MPRGTRARVLLALQRQQWQTIQEIAGHTGLHRNTVTRYLNDMVRQGEAHRRVDSSAHSPRGTGAQTYAWLDTPLPPVQPTTEILCHDCAEAAYADILRYMAACDPATLECRQDAIWSGVGLPCDRCSELVWEPWDDAEEPLDDPA
jgi:hypothetical protein